MDSTTPAGCHKLSPNGRHGDVDINGDLVDELRAVLPDGRRLTQRLNGAVGTCVGFDREEQIANVRADVSRIRNARGLA